MNQPITAAREVVHGLAEVDDQARAEEGVHHPDLVAAVRRADGGKQRLALVEHAADRLRRDRDVVEVGHIRGREHPAVGIDQLDEDLLFTRRLGFEHGLALHGLNALAQHDRRKGAHLGQQVLVGAAPDRGGDQVVEKGKGDAGRDQKDARIPEGQAQRQAVAQARQTL
jgi:hypothetical protein